MKRVLLTFFIFNILGLAEENEKIDDIFINSSLKLSQNDLKKGKEELREMSYKFVDYYNKNRLQLVNNYFDDIRELEKKVLKGVDKDINFDRIMDCLNDILKGVNSYNISKISVEKVEMLSDDTIIMKTFESVPDVSIENRNDFQKEVLDAFNEELKKDASFSNKDSLKNIDEYRSRFLSMKPQNYVKVKDSYFELRKINGNWEISKINEMVMNDNIPLTNLFDLTSKDLEAMLDSSDSSRLKQLEMTSKVFGMNINVPKIVEGIVLCRRDSRVSISKNEIKDIIGEFKGTHKFPYEIGILDKNILKLKLVSVEHNNNTKGVQFETVMYKKENGKWIIQKQKT